MIISARRFIRAFVGGALLTTLLTAAPRAQSPAPPQPPQQPEPPPRPTFRVGTELVLVNVVVRDGKGNVVRGLTRDDFTITEDDKPQQISSFDFEELDNPNAAPAAAPAEPVLPKTPKTPKTKGLTPAVENAPKPAPIVDMHGRRLIVLFFDLASMQNEEVTRAAKAAHEYVDKKLAPTDLIAVVSFSTALNVDQDFTDDKEQLFAAIDQYGGSSGQGFEAGATGDDEGTPDTGGAFTPDDTEFNLFSTDRRLQALQTLADALSGIQQKKSVIYFSSGMSQSGSDNQVELKRTVDRAIRANVSFYAADLRGLVALPAGGEARQASARGASPFSGATMTSAISGLSASQDTLTTMAEDTGGRAFFDSNDFGDVFNRVVADTSAYYVLGYSSTNSARDGRYRHIKVALTKRKDLKLEYRSGYYGPRDFQHTTRDDREQQLQQQLLSDLSSTDLSAYVAPAFFRVSDTSFFVPMSVVVPGYQLPFGPATDKNKATLDVLGVVVDEKKRPVGRIRDTMKLAVTTPDELKRKTVQYETGLDLAPGKYHVKVVVRENENGTMGSYETDFVVPDPKKETAGVKLSSVVIGTQLQAGARKNDRNPLVRNGQELVPNVTRVVSPGQHLYFYYEVYDPASTPKVKLLTSIAFFRGRVRAFETPIVETTELTAPDRKAAVFQFDVPAASLTPGLYTCQINVIDDVAGTFTFPRMQLYVRK
jgi:VWFA-related protein